MISRMVLGKLLHVCEEELRQAVRLILAAYEFLREADNRALHTLFIFLGLR
jgi:hypothetical protein